MFVRARLELGFADPEIKKRDKRLLKES